MERSIPLKVNLLDANGLITLKNSIAKGYFLFIQQQVNCLIKKDNFHIKYKKKQSNKNFRARVLKVNKIRQLKLKII